MPHHVESLSHIHHGDVQGTTCILSFGTDDDGAVNGGALLSKTELQSAFVLFEGAFDD